MDTPASPSERYVQILRLPAVCRATGLGRSMVYQLEAANRPRRIRMGARAVGRIEAEIQSWLVDRNHHVPGTVDLPVERPNSTQRFEQTSTSQVSPR
ncbi:MAG TPA: AlpA family phage regulatory protein [Steroidobacteraceae bacterium]|nr:AlpA family phage regulatory protein [Steroidobacteraceae bacterium]